MRPVVVYQPHPGVGDLMWHLPFIRAIAEYGAAEPVVLFARQTTSARQLLRAEPWIGAVHYVPYKTGPLRHPRELLATWRLLRSVRPRAVWILDKITRPAIAAWLAGVPERHGFGLDGQAPWLTGAHIDPALATAHQIEKLSALLRASGIPLPATEPALAVPPDLRAACEERYGQRPRPWLMLGVGARGAARCWPLENFARLVEGFDGRGTVFVFGGRDDGARVEREIIARTTHPSSVNACALRMDEAAGLMRGCDLFVGNDSGPLNVAAAVGTPAIGLFGTTPPLAHSRFIHAEASPAGDRRMDAIEVERVLARVRELLP